MQRCALYIILGDQYSSYRYALDYLSYENLEERRKKICENFARKASKHQKYKHWFSEKKENPARVNTRKAKKFVKMKYHPAQYRTERYRDSPIPYLTELLNS